MIELVFVRVGAAIDVVAQSIRRRGCQRSAAELRIGFEAAGYPLAVLAFNGRALLEVYPHPALIERASADRRMPYKHSKSRKYWLDETRDARRLNLFETWRRIAILLDAQIQGVRDALPLPPCCLRMLKECLKDLSFDVVATNPCYDSFWRLAFRCSRIRAPLHDAVRCATLSPSILFLN
ncbi:hypothetical protein [Rhizobium laguerreae]|uniref:hypothetical protein n=1 Tax=Rhizobium laguerreae TaxID=1076926 RepID=UPI0014420CA8|nr:hypothetical protein [Rhizobium laguerreae]NKN12295.1 hypothetical protein [Rhizobium laguerreae]